MLNKIFFNYYIIKIIFIILFIYLIINLKKKVKNKIYNINFLDIKESHEIYNNYNAINYYNKNEIKYRSKNKTFKRDEMIKLYKKNCMLFTQKDKKYITKTIENIYNRFSDSDFPLINKWNFIKVSSNFDFGFPYTINDVIIIPSNYCNYDNLEKTLFHEQFHIIQYKNKIKFEKFYKKNWNFKKIILPKNKWLNEHIITNPDGYKNFYYIKIKGEKILPILVLIKNKLKGIGIYLNKKNLYYKNLDNINYYYNKFYKINQNYHPNEIFACLMVKYGYDNLKMNKKIINFLNILQN